MQSYFKKIPVVTLSLLALTACDKKTSEQNHTIASVPVASSTIASSTPTLKTASTVAESPTPIASTANASNYAKVMSTAIIGGFLISYAHDAQLDAKQRECLLQGDLTKSAPQLQAVFDQNQSAADKKAFDAVYGDDVGTRTIEFTKQSINYSMGLVEKEPIMNAQDKAKIDPFNKSEAAQHLKKSLDEKQVLTIVLPVVNEQIKRCDLKEIPLQAILSQLPPSASK